MVKILQELGFLCFTLLNENSRKKKLQWYAAYEEVFFFFRFQCTQRSSWPSHNVSWQQTLHFPPSVSSMTAISAAALRHYQKALRHSLLIYGVINVGLSVEMGGETTDESHARPAKKQKNTKNKKKQFWLKSRTFRPAFPQKDIHHVRCWPALPNCVPLPACPRLEVIVQCDKPKRLS